MSEQTQVVKDEHDAIEALRTVVAGREDFVYHSPDGAAGLCVNFNVLDAYRPSCVVGHVLDLWGLPQELRPVAADGSVHRVNLKLRDKRSPFVMSMEAMQVLAAAQKFQDEQGTWGGALAKAEEVYGTLMEGM